jgi:uncharacterized membrane protein YoaT (DUF817 family)
MTATSKLSKRLRNALFTELAAFSVLVLCVSLLWRNNLLLFFVALTQGAVVLWLWHDRFDLSILFVIGGVGSIAEAVFVQFGVWHYTNPTFFGVPLWFPLSFGTAGLIGGRLARTLAEIWDELSPSHGSEARAGH